jgi:hypothetical protein
MLLRNRRYFLARTKISQRDARRMIYSLRAPMRDGFLLKFQQSWTKRLAERYLDGDSGACAPFK